MKIKTSYKIQLIALAAFFPVVLYFMYALNSGKFNFDFLFGSNPMSYNLCPTRITKIQEISTYSHVSIVQENLQWKRTYPTEQTLTPTTMEKWLGRHCMVQLDALIDFETVRRESAEPLSQDQIQYIDGSTTSLSRYPKGIYQTANRAFTSNALDLALAQLATLD